MGDGTGFRFSTDNVKRETGMLALASRDRLIIVSCEITEGQKVNSNVQTNEFHVDCEFVDDEPGLCSVQPVHVGDGHRGVRQGAALVKVAAVDARDQRRLDVLPAGDGAPVAVGVAVGGARVPRGAGVAAGRRNDVEDDPMAAPALRMTEAKPYFKREEGSFP